MYDLNPAFVLCCEPVGQLARPIGRAVVDDHNADAIVLQYLSHHVLDVDLLVVGGKHHHGSHSRPIIRFMRAGAQRTGGIYPLTLCSRALSKIRPRNASL